MDGSGQVTLLFYKISDAWWREPALNWLAAFAQGSKYCHVELSIGTDGHHGQSHVLRIYNDKIGAELTPRRGTSPNLHYVQLGCTLEQERRMLNFARAQVGKPFSQSAMFRSLFMPRKSNGESWFCAELVAACLRHGGLLDPSSNPGAATPQNMHSLFSTRATVTANPYILRQAETARKLTTNSVVDPRASALWLTQSRNGYAPVQSSCASGLKVLHAGLAPVDDRQTLGLTLNSLIGRTGVGR